MRKHPPGTATSQDVEDRIDNLPQPILAGPAVTLRDWDQRGNELPLGLTEVTGWRRRHDDFRGEGLEIGHNISALSKENTEITVFIHPLGVISFQVRLWLAKMLSDGDLEKTRQPVRYYLAVSDTKHAPPKDTRSDGAPTDLIIGKVRILLAELLINPKIDKEIAKTLGVTSRQISDWLQLLMNEGAIQKSFRPVKYYLGQPDLFSGR